MRTSWQPLLAYVLILLAAGSVLVVVDPPGLPRSAARLFESPIDLIVGGILIVQALRLIRLGFHAPRLTLDPLGITDHSTGRGLLLWSDFARSTYDNGIGASFRPPTIRLHSTAEICWHYNQRIPGWKRLSSARILGSRSIVIRVVGLDVDRLWLDAEIARRIRQRSDV